MSDRYVVWRRHSDYRDDGHVNVSLSVPRDYRNRLGMVTYEILLDTGEWQEARDLVKELRGNEDD